MTVNATDSGAGLHNTAYSFDNGTIRQTGDKKVFTGNQDVNIKVKDAVGNITSTGIKISNIDTEKPT